MKNMGNKQPCHHLARTFGQLSYVQNNHADRCYNCRDKKRAQPLKRSSSPKEANVTLSETTKLKCMNNSLPHFKLL